MLDLCLKHTIFYKSLKTISAYLFSECRNLKKLVIQEGVTKIESGAFSFGTYLQGDPDVSKMRDLIIPASVEYIEEGAFSVWTGTPTGYTETFTITFLGTEPPPFIEASQFAYIYLPTAIYVPDEALDTYKTSTLEFWNWWVNTEKGALLPLSQKPSNAE